MDASESPPNSTHRHHQRNHRHHPQPRNTHATAPYQTNPDTDTTDAPNTPDTTPSSITHLRHFATFPNRHRQHATTHRSVRRVSSNDTPGLGARNSLAETLSPVQLQLLQHQQQQQAIATGTRLPLPPTTIVSPAPASTRFNFAAFWNPRRLFSAVRPASTPPLPFPSPSSSSSTTSPTPSPPSSSGTVSRMVTSGDREGDSSTPTPSTISKSSSSSSMRSLVAQGESLSQGHRGGPRRSSLSVKPAFASTTVAVTLPPSSDPGPSASSTSGRRRRHQDMSQTRSQQSLASVSGGFSALSISRSGGDSSDLRSNNGSNSTHKSGSSSNGLDSSSCYPSPTSPDSPSTVATAALERIQKRIAQGQGQLVQYTDMIHKHETDRTEYVTLQASRQEQREVLEREIEVLESAIRQGPCTPVSPLSTFFSSANPIFGQGGGSGSTLGYAVARKSPPSFFSWSSPPSSYEDCQDCHQGHDTPCCPFNEASTRANAPTSSAPTPINTTPTITTTSNVTPTTAFPRRSSTSTLSTPHNQRLSLLLPSSPSSSGPFFLSGPTRSRSTSSLHVTFSASGSSSSLSSPSKSYVSYRQLQPIPSTRPLLPPPLPPPSIPFTSSPAAAAVPLQMCRRCSQKSTLTELRDQLRNVQRSIDQVQQKIHSTNSQIRHLQRTFVLPIEKYLQEDQDELGRLLELPMLQSERERQQRQHQQQQQHDGGGEGSRPISGSSSSPSGGDGRGGAMYRKKYWTQSRKGTC